MKPLTTLVLVTFLTILSNSNVYATSSDNQSGDNKVVANEKVIEDSAGVLPNSSLYGLERALEKLKITITVSEEKLAAFKAKIATERAAEAVIMVDEGLEDLAKKATAEYFEMLASATEHINNAIEAKDETFEMFENFNESYQRSEEILKILLEKVPESLRESIEGVLKEQDMAIKSVNGFYAAKTAFFEAEERLEEAKKRLEVAKESGNTDALRIAEKNVIAAQILLDELKGVKVAAEKAKEKVKLLLEIAEEQIEFGTKQTPQ